MKGRQEAEAAYQQMRTWLAEDPSNRTVVGGCEKFGISVKTYYAHKNKSGEPKKQRAKKQGSATPVRRETLLMAAEPPRPVRATPRSGNMLEGKSIILVTDTAGIMQALMALSKGGVPQ